MKPSSDSHLEPFVDLLSAMLFVAVLALLALMLLNKQATGRVEAVGHRLQQQVMLRTGLARDLSKVLGSIISVDRQSGNVRISEDALTFRRNAWAVGHKGRKLLARITPLLAKVAFSPTYRPYLRKIVVEGHTDSSRAADDSFYNWRLSSRRALAVAGVMLNSAGADRELLERYIEASGMANRRPVLDSTGKEDAARSRRMEIKVFLDDRELVKRFAKEIEKTSGRGGRD